MWGEARRGAARRGARLPPSDAPYDIGEETLAQERDISLLYMRAAAGEIEKSSVSRRSQLNGGASGDSGASSTSVASSAPVTSSATAYMA